MDPRSIEELRQKYINGPPEGMTAKLVKNMTDSDLLDMHYFLTEDDDLDGDGSEEGLYIFVLSLCPPPAGYFNSRFLRQEEFPIRAQNNEQHIDPDIILAAVNDITLA